VFHHRISGEFSGTVGGTIAANHTNAFHIGRSFDGFKGILSNVSVADDGSANFLFHKK